MQESEHGYIPLVLPDKLIGDQIRLKQIIINLIKFMVKSSSVEQIVVKASYDYAA